ncbi:MAG: S8 family serine peptidase [Candidatus Bathyarchaeia archaeon]|jgi:hypothetical protein
MSWKETDYLPENHLFLHPTKVLIPKPVSRGGYPPPDCHINDKAPIIENQFDKTISAVESKVASDNAAYYIIDLRVPKEHPNVEFMLKKFNATILSELGASELLVTSSISDLKSAKNALELRTFRKNLFNIHDLRVNDVIDPDLNYQDECGKNLTIYLVPNLGVEKAKFYIEQIKHHLNIRDIPISSIFINNTTGDATLDVIVKARQLNELVYSFGFIFKVHESLQVQCNPSTSEVGNAELIAEKRFEKTDVASLPKICLLDTGITPVNGLKRFILQRTVEPPFTDLDDLDDHGTAVASLAVYGDNIAQMCEPKACVISHKIMENKKGANLTGALKNAISLYKNCNVFNCSVNHNATKLGSVLTTRSINNIAQESNKIIVFSSGNIDPEDVENSILSGSNYPNYIMAASVSHPSDAPSVLCVGAYSVFSDPPNSIAPEDAPAPFTLYGSNLKELKDCPKPELVEHGGNLCICKNQMGAKRYHCDKVGINVVSNSGRKVRKMGTSFSAPLVSLHSALLWDYFGHHVKNSETIKALLLSTCQPTQYFSRFTGLGVPDKNEMFTSSYGTIRVVFEGSLQLIDTKTNKIPTEELKVFVPGDVASIELFLTHSDNYALSFYPKLNTYLDVEVEKPGKDGIVAPTIGKSKSKTHVKHLVYNYEKNVKGDWFFRIIPHAIGISTAQRKNVVIRYGAVIKMTTKNARSGVGESILQGLNRGQEAIIGDKLGQVENDA